MRNFARLSLGFCFLVSTHVTATENVRYVFNGKSLDLPKMTFGLSTQQADAILKLTNGEVDFTNTYYADAPAAPLSLLNDSQTEVLHPNVPLPFTFQEIQYAGDPSLLNQWWIQSLKVPQAWKHATGQGVVIADCDAGYYHDEPDLRANMLLNHRYDLSSSSPYVVDDGGMTSHGTAVAAIMAGVLDGSGTSGIAYNAKIVPLQNFKTKTKIVWIKKKPLHVA